MLQQTDSVRKLAQSENSHTHSSSNISEAELPQGNLGALALLTHVLDCRGSRLILALISLSAFTCTERSLAEPNDKSNPHPSSPTEQQNQEENQKQIGEFGLSPSDHIFSPNLRDYLVQLRAQRHQQQQDETSNSVPKPLMKRETFDQMVEPRRPSARTDNLNHGFVQSPLLSDLKKSMAERSAGLTESRARAKQKLNSELNKVESEDSANSEKILFEAINNYNLINAPQKETDSEKDTSENSKSSDPKKEKQEAVVPDVGSIAMKAPTSKVGESKQKKPTPRAPSAKPNSATKSTQEVTQTQYSPPDGYYLLRVEEYISTHPNLLGLLSAIIDHAILLDIKPAPDAQLVDSNYERLTLLDYVLKDLISFANTGQHIDREASAEEKKLLIYRDIVCRVFSDLLPGLGDLPTIMDLATPEIKEKANPLTQAEAKKMLAHITKVTNQDKQAILEEAFNLRHSKDFEKLTQKFLGEGFPKAVPQDGSAGGNMHIFDVP